MKEYIDKKDMIETFVDEFCKDCSKCGGNCIHDELFETIDKVKTATQSEIESLAYYRGARAFAEKLKDELIGVHPEIFNNAKYSRQDIIDFINGTLNEMGCCDE